jgi:D-xylose transport system substrate-binding protein
MIGRVRRGAIAASLLSLVLAGAAGCGGDGGSGGTTGAGSPAATGGEPSGKIALLLPESKTARYEAFDRPLFEAKVKALCPACQVLYQNADQDPSKQQTQAESVLTEGIKVLVLDPVDSKAAASVTNSAKGQGIPVVAYDRFINGPIDYYISFDNEKVGQVQGQALLEALQKGGDPKRGPIVAIHGSPTDNNAGQFKKGALSVLQNATTIAAQYDVPDWSPDKAQAWMDGQISAIGKDRIIGVYAANDGTAGGAIAAMKAAGISPLPPVTGQDAELAGIQRIVAGDQYMTVYKAIRPEAEKAAEVAVELLKGNKPAGDQQVEGIPSTLFDPVPVTKDKIKDTVVKDGFWTVDKICTGQYKAACGQVGLQ